MLWNRFHLKTTFKLLKGPLVPIVADAAIATTAWGYGRLIPLVILDTSDRPDVEEFIRVHQYSEPGDVISQWATIKDGSGRVALNLNFDGPMSLNILLAFDPEKQGGLVDQIVNTKGLYLQAGRPGDRLINNPDLPKVIANIPETGFSRVWEDIFFQAAVKRARSSGCKTCAIKRYEQTSSETGRTRIYFRVENVRKFPSAKFIKCLLPRLSKTTLYLSKKECCSLLRCSALA